MLVFCPPNSPHPPPCKLKEDTFLLAWTITSFYGYLFILGVGSFSEVFTQQESTESTHSRPFHADVHFSEEGSSSFFCPEQGAQEKLKLLTKITYCAVLGWDMPNTIHCCHQSHPSRTRVYISILASSDHSWFLSPYWELLSSYLQKNSKLRNSSWDHLFFLLF